jgi:GNAT superfamily N-acetyltransferase
MPILYRHYKDKPYRFLGTVKHSETLEDMALYETLYENSAGKLWVRPKGMFFEQVEVAGKEVPRFAKVAVELEEREIIGEAEAEILAPLIQEAFGEWDPEFFFSRLKVRNRVHLVMARIDGKLVGFKLGYAEDAWDFYSWLGAVAPSHRRVGIASTLMAAQEAWCKKQGFQTIKTKTQNRFREMLLLNIRQGFSVIGFHESRNGGGKIILEKRLLSS